MASVKINFKWLYTPVHRLYSFSTIDIGATYFKHLIFSCLTQIIHTNMSKLDGATRLTFASVKHQLLVFT